MFNVVLFFKTFCIVTRHTFVLDEKYITTITISYLDSNAVPFPKISLWIGGDCCYGRGTLYIYDPVGISVDVYARRGSCNGGDWRSDNRLLDKCHSAWKNFLVVFLFFYFLFFFIQYFIIFFTYPPLVAGS